MKTISAKQLRTQLEQTFDDVANGEDVIVTYRAKSPVRITSAAPNNRQSRATLNGLAAFDAAPKKKTANSLENLELKDMYKNAIESKHGKS